MALYKYETHMHTSQGSDCASTNGAKWVEVLKEQGYTGCFITDHFFGGNTAVRGEMAGYPWEVRVRLFCQGYDDAKKRGDEIGFQVFFGLEFGWRATEFLTYGIDMQFLLDHPEIDNMPINYFADLVHKCGGFVVHAHPFRQAPYISTIRLYPDKVDGVEVYNCGNADEFNERADWYAKSFGLPATGGSDAHHWAFHPGGGIALDSKLESPMDYLERLKKGKINQILTRQQPKAHDGINIWEDTVRPDVGKLPPEVYAKYFSEEQK